MYSISKLKQLAGPLWWDVITTPKYQEKHPRCYGGDKEKCRYLAWSGDAILYWAVTNHLIKENGFATSEEQALGELDSRRQVLTSRYALAEFAETIGLRSAIRKTKKDKSWTNKNWIAEQVEVLIAAVYQHGGEEAMRNLVHDIIITTRDDIQHPSLRNYLRRKGLRYCVVEWENLHKILTRLPKALRARIIAIEREGKASPERLTRIRDILIREGIFIRDDRLEGLSWKNLHHMMPNLSENVRIKIVAIEQEGKDNLERLPRIREILTQEGVLQVA